MKHSYYKLVLDIAFKHGISMPSYEEQLTNNASLLAICVDELLVDELIEHGFQENCELNLYGQQIESAIDYYNRKRYALQMELPDV